MRVVVGWTRGQRPRWRSRRIARARSQNPQTLKRCVCESINRPRRRRRARRRTRGSRRNARARRFLRAVSFRVSERRGDGEVRRSNRIRSREEKRRDENAPGSIRLAHVKKVAFVTQVLWRVGGTNSPVGDGRGVERTHLCVASGARWACVWRLARRRSAWCARGRASRPAPRRKRESTRPYTRADRCFAETGRSRAARVVFAGRRGLEGPPWSLSRASTADADSAATRPECVVA